MAGLVARMAETLHQSVGHEFRCQVALLFLQMPFFSSCEASKVYTSTHQLANTTLITLK